MRELCPVFVYAAHNSLERNTDGYFVVKGKGRNITGNVRRQSGGKDHNITKLEKGPQVHILCYSDEWGRVDDLSESKTIYQP